MGLSAVQWDSQVCLFDDPRALPRDPRNPGRCQLSEPSDRVMRVLVAAIHVPARLRLDLEPGATGYLNRARLARHVMRMKVDRSGHLRH